MISRAAVAALCLAVLSAALPQAYGLMPAQAEQTETLAQSSAGEPLALGDTPVAVTLEPIGPVFAARQKGPATNEQIYLILQNLRAAPSFDTSYELYFDLPADAKPDRDGPYYVSDFDFFDAQSGRRSAAFNVTEIFAALRGSGRLTPQPRVTIVSKAAGAGAVPPTIGKIELIAVSR